jgi:hypothetical protein
MLLGSNGQPYRSWSSYFGPPSKRKSTSVRLFYTLYDEPDVNTKVKMHVAPLWMEEAVVEQVQKKYKVQPIERVRFPSAHLDVGGPAWMPKGVKSHYTQSFGPRGRSYRLSVDGFHAGLVMDTLFEAMRGRKGHRRIYGGVEAIRFSSFPEGITVLPRCDVDDICDWLNEVDRKFAIRTKNLP